MDITHFGGGQIRIATKTLNIVINPVAGRKVSADLVLVTDGVDTGEFPMTIDGPGEYEIKGVSVRGVGALRHIDEAGTRSTMYAIDADGVRAVYLGNIAEGLSNSQLEDIGNPDVLIVPVGGHGLTLDAEAANGMISKLEPKYVVPVHYDDGFSKYEMPQAKLEDFLKEIGTTAEPVPKLRVNSKDMPEETTVVVIEPQK